MDALNIPLLFRQAVTDRAQQLLGYYLAGPADTPLSVALPDAWQADGDGQPAGPLIFLHATAEQLARLESAEIGRRHCVYLLDGRQPLDETVAGQVVSLAQEGVRFALWDADPAAPSADWHDALDFIAVNLRRIGPMGALQVARKAARQPGRMLAMGVDSPELSEFCLKAGYGLLCGASFMAPPSGAQRQLAPSQAIVVEAMDMLRKDADDRVLEDLLKRDAALSVKILRYINSAGFGLSCQVESIQHAIQILGRRELYRWLTLLLVTSGNTPPVVTRTAVIRGRFCELLGRGLLDRRDADSLFIVGLFSMLGIMLGTTLEQAFESMILPEAIEDALLRREGIFAPFIELVEACEQPTQAAHAARVAQSLGLSPASVDRVHLDSLVWLETLGI